MKRLTGRTTKGDLLFMGIQVYAGDFYEAISALEQYEDAEEQGRLVMLHFKRGDTVYKLCELALGSLEIRSYKIINVEVITVELSDGDLVQEPRYTFYNGRADEYIHDVQIGHLYFKTREEAEQELKERC